MEGRRTAEGGEREADIGGRWKGDGQKMVEKGRYNAEGGEKEVNSRRQKKNGRLRRKAG